MRMIARENVLDDPEVILVIRDVVGSASVSRRPTMRCLLGWARASTLPARAHRANDLGRIGKVLADLRKKGEIAVSGGVVVAKRVSASCCARRSVARSTSSLARSSFQACALTGSQSRRARPPNTRP